MASRYQPKPEAFNFTPKGAEPLRLPGVPGELYRKDGCLWWKMPDPATVPMRPLRAQDTLYGRFPDVRTRLTPAKLQQSDTATTIGRVRGEAAAAFSRHEPIHIVFYPKIRKSGPWLRFPEEVERFVPTLAQILLAERANLPVPELWDYVRPSIRISCGPVGPGDNARVVEDTLGVQQGWHKHLATDRPMPADKLAMNLGEYVVSDSLPTILCDGYSEPHGEAERTALADDHILLPKGREPRARAVLNMVVPLSHSIGMMSQQSHHNSQINDGTPRFRNFLRVFHKLDPNDLAAFRRDHPGLYETLPLERPTSMQVPQALAP